MNIHLAVTIKVKIKNNVNIDYNSPCLGQQL